MGAALLLLSNIGLVMMATQKEERWILIPQMDTDHRIPLGSDSYSDEYLRTWAGSITGDLYTVNPVTADEKARRFLEVAATSYGSLKDDILKSTKKIKSEKLSTVFYPKTFEIDRGTSKVLVRGEFLTFFGRDKAPVSREVTFALTYKKGPRGIILVENLEEVKDA